jgi:hypothetical protein
MMPIKKGRYTDDMDDALPYICNMEIIRYSISLPTQDFDKQDFRGTAY